MDARGTSPDEIRHVCVVGAGSIGASWVALFLGRGLKVSVYDPVPERRAYVGAYLDAAWPAVSALGGLQGPVSSQWEFFSTLRSATKQVSFVQESAPEDADLKRTLYAELDGLLAPDIIIASSTSSLRMTDLQQGLNSPQRFIVAHPFNPPHLIPLVEIVGGQQTSAEVIEYCRSFFERLGKNVIVLRKEVKGHLVNRLQAALFQEALWLVQQGVASTEEVDCGIALAAALRWTLMGTFLTYHLGATDGIRDYLRKLGDAHVSMWRDLGRIDQLTPELVDAVARQVDAESGGQVPEALARSRDQALIALMRFLAEPGRRLIGG
jgi:carnitine 3-dehydrogenase